jgi:transposase
VTVIQAYRFALDPTPAQERALRSHAGASRFAWNWGLAKVRERYAAEGAWYTGIDLHKMWNAAKKANLALAWWGENSKCVYQEAFNDLHRALRNFDKSRKGLRKGKRLRWFASFTVEVERAIPARHARPGSAIGVDLGVKTLLTGVDDRGRIIKVTGPKALRFSLRRLRRASRAHSRKARGGANRRKAAGKLARVHARVASVRADALHKATTGLACRYQTVIAEDLNVTGMLANRKLARAVADQGSAPHGASWAIRRYGTAERSWWPTAGTPAPRPARRADSESQA